MDRPNGSAAERKNETSSGLLGASTAESDSWSFVSKLTTLRVLAGIWSIAAFLDLVISFSGGGRTVTIARACFTYCCGFGLSFIDYRFLTRTPENVADLSFLRTLVIAVPSGTALFFIDIFGRAFAHGDSPFAAWPTDYILRLRPMWSYFTMLFIFQSAIAWLTTSARILALRERQLLEARLAALRLQLNPHFLFNTLNSVLTLINEAETAEAETMIMRLSDFLRVSLSDQPALFISLADEIDMVHAYLDIEAVRFGDRLKVRYACEPGLAEAQVPNFVLQPLVENAVKHAVARSRDPVTIRIEAKCDGDVLALTVEDDARVRPEVACTPGNGVGIRNIAMRLDALYGKAGQIETSRREVGFTAQLRFPLTWPA